jgi:hypothetical protein
MAESARDPYGIVPRRVLRPLLDMGLSEAAVWIALATYADGNGASAWPSQATIIADTGLCRRRVQTAIAALERAGAIRRDGYQTRGVVRWQVVLDFSGAPRMNRQKRTRVRTSAHRSAPAHKGAQVGTSVRLTGAQACAPTSAHGCAQPDPLTRPRPDHSPLRACEAHGGSASAPPPVNSPHGSGQEPEVEERAQRAGTDPPAAAQPRQDAARAPTAPPGVTQDSPMGDRPAAAAAARPPPDPHREPEDLPFAEMVEVEARDLFERKLGAHIPAERRLAALATLVRDYRRRWPKSWPSDWGACSELPDLCGPIKDRAAWIWAHVVGYAREGWKPENRDGSEREWHALLLEGRLGEALRAKQIEASYRGENTTREQKAHGRRATRTLMRLVAEDPDLKSSVESVVTSVASERPEGAGESHDLHRSRPAGSREARP